MSEQTIAEKSLEIRQETEEFANTRGRVANVLDDLNSTKANKSDVAQSFIDQNQNLQNHINDQANPHQVTKSQIGLGNVDNTSDVNKPISTATQAAINALASSVNTSLGNKVDKTTITITAPDSTFKYAYIFDESNNVRRMLAGDLGKNVANSALTSIAGAGLTLGANWTLNASGFYYSITGLADVSSDSTFNTLLTQNSAGRVAKSNGKSVFMSLPTLLNETEKTTWKTAMNGGWTTNSMSVAIITPPIIDKSNKNTWVSLKGANLNLNPASFSVGIVANDGTTLIANIPGSQVQLYTNGIDLTFYYNFKDLPIGNYKIRLWNGVAYYVTGQVIQIVNTITPVNLNNLIWETVLYTPGTTGVLSVTGGALSYNSKTANKAYASENVIVAAAKSSQLIAAAENFYIAGTVYHNETASLSQGKTILGLLNPLLSLALLNSSSTNIRIESNNIANQSKTIWADNLVAIGTGNAPTITIDFSIARNGGNYILLISYNGSVKIGTKVASTEALSLCFYANNSLEVLTSGFNISECYVF